VGDGGGGEGFEDFCFCFFIRWVGWLRG
jgi:hypothetical protein